MEHLAENLPLYKRMKDLALRQELTLSLDRMDLFFQLANQREQLRQRVVENEKRHASPGEGPRRNELNGRIRSVAEDILEVIRSIQEIDRKTEEFLFRERGSLLAEIRNLKVGQKALKGYGARSPREARFIDRNS
jgi:hypothetical protein